MLHRGCSLHLSKYFSILPMASSLSLATTRHQLRLILIGTYPKAKDYNQLNELATGLRFGKYRVDHVKRFMARTADSREEASRLADWTKLHRELCKEAVKESPISI